MKRFKAAPSFVSGWMARYVAPGGGERYERGFHASAITPTWNGLAAQAVRDSGARQVYVTTATRDGLSRYHAANRGIDAEPAGALSGGARRRRVCAASTIG